MIATLRIGRVYLTIKRYWGFAAPLVEDGFYSAQWGFLVVEIMPPCPIRDVYSDKR